MDSNKNSLISKYLNRLPRHTNIKIKKKTLFDICQKNIGEKINIYSVLKEIL